MTASQALSPDAALRELDDLANRSLALWPLPEGARARRINVSENVTYLVEAGDARSVLRLHRPGYLSPAGIGTELAWLSDLANSGTVLTARPLPGHNGALVQHTGDPVSGRYMVMFSYIPGRQPRPDDDLVQAFDGLGYIAACSHLHSQAWTPPAPPARLIWDADAILGTAATWGDWRDAPNVTPDVRAVLEAVVPVLRARLAAYGKTGDRFGLIHGDMRLANLLIDAEGQTWLIDFDDCGFGWYLYDFAAAISFMEDHPQVPALRAAWVRGYRRARALSDAEEAEIDSFVLLRRIALLAWIGSHMDAPEPREMAPHFATGTALIAKAYLEKYAPKTPE